MQITITKDNFSLMVDNMYDRSIMEDVYSCVEHIGTVADFALAEDFTQFQSRVISMYDYFLHDNSVGSIDLTNTEAMYYFWITQHKDFVKNTIKSLEPEDQQELSEQLEFDFEELKIDEDEGGSVH